MYVSRAEVKKPLEAAFYIGSSGQGIKPLNLESCAYFCMCVCRGMCLSVRMKCVLSLTHWAKTHFMWKILACQLTVPQSLVSCDAEVVVSKLGCISEPKTCFLGPLLPVDANGSRVESALREVWSRRTEMVPTILVYLSWGLLLQQG